MVKIKKPVVKKKKKKLYLQTNRNGLAAVVDGFCERPRRIIRGRLSLSNRRGDTENVPTLVEHPARTRP